MVFTILSNNTTLLSSLNVSGFTGQITLITLENDVTAIHGILPNSEIQFEMISSISIDCFTK